MKMDKPKKSVFGEFTGVMKGVNDDDRKIWIEKKRLRLPTFQAA
jgi:hypothetical protein